MADFLDSEQRRNLAETMLQDVLAAFGRAGLIQNCFVVTSDPKAMKLARATGSGVVEENSDMGVNAAVLRGMESLSGAGQFMVVPSDLPLISHEDIWRASRMAEAFDVVLTPSMMFNGTNLLAYSTEKGISLSYDVNSFWNHLSGAAHSGFTLSVLCAKGIMFDVDTPEDLRILGMSRADRRSVRFAKKVFDR